MSQVNHEEESDDVLQQVDDLESDVLQRVVDDEGNDDKHPVEEVETDSKESEKAQEELPRTSTGRIIRAPKKLNL